MGVQSKAAKIKAKKESLVTKLHCSISANKPEQTAFIEEILKRCVGEEEEMRTEWEKRRQRNKTSISGIGIKGDIWNGYFQKLPDEVLEMIVGKLSNSADLASLSNTCKLWQRILAPTKSTWLFHMILPHLLQNEYLKPKDIYKCRYVCTGWQNAVDDILYNLAKPVGPNVFEFYVPRLTLEKISIAMNNIMRKPVFGKRLSLCIYCKEEENDFLEFYLSHHKCVTPAKAVKFLKRFGEHFWDVTISLIGIETNFLPLLRSCVENLKNVRRLTIGGYCAPFEVEMERFLAENQFLRLAHLVSLDVTGMSNPFFNHVFPLYSQQLNKLCVNILAHYKNTLPASPISIPVGHPRRLENLAELIWQQETTDMSTLLSLECPNLKVFKLTITSYEWTANGHKPLGKKQLFEVLQYFGKQLKQLGLTLPGYAPLGNDVTQTEYFKTLGMLQLPHLKKLELDGWRESLDILLCMPSLQYFSVNWVPWGLIYKNNVPAEDREAVIEISEYAGSPYLSNIWTVMPSIRKIRMRSASFITLPINGPRFYNFTREGYELFNLERYCSNKAI